MADESARRRCACGAVCVRARVWQTLNKIYYGHSLMIGTGAGQ